MLQLFGRLLITMIKVSFKFFNFFNFFFIFMINFICKNNGTQHGCRLRMRLMPHSMEMASLVMVKLSSGWDLLTKRTKLGPKHRRNVDRRIGSNGG